MFRSILAVVAGYVAMALSVMACVAVLALIFPEYRRAAETGITPTLPMVIELLWAIPSAMLGGFVTARIARRSPRTHAALLAGIVLALGIVFGITGGGGPLPGWFLILLPPVSAISVLIGGRHVKATGPAGMPGPRSQKSVA